MKHPNDRRQKQERRNDQLTLYIAEKMTISTKFRMNLNE